MSTRVCHLETHDRGAVLERLRLLGDHTDDDWTPPEASSLKDASSWVKERLGTIAGSPNTLEVLCLDGDGTICTWLGIDRTDEAHVEAVIRQGGGYDFDEVTTPSRFGVDSQDVGASTIQALRGEVEEETRVAVLSLPDLCARLFIDALDGVGVNVGRVTTIWHALCTWDPSARAFQSVKSGDVAVAESTGLAGIVLVDPRGRLLWAWSEAGRLVASGSMRLVHRADDALELHEQDVGRLTSEWLAWSLQLGHAPSQVVALVPPGTEGLSHGAFGQRLGEAWGQSTVNLMPMEDPIGETLRRVGGLEKAGDDRQTGVVSLSNRPGRAHRRMYWLAFAALLFGGIALVVLGARLGMDTSELRDEARSLGSETTMTVQESVPELMGMDKGMVLMELEGRVAQAERQSSRPVLPPPKPILQQVQSIARVLGYEDVQLNRFQVTKAAVTVEVTVPDIEWAEGLFKALESDSEYVEWRDPNFTTRGSVVVATFTALWRDLDG